ncbi:MAG: helix-turn-helix domain-containing protein [SAR202 cluster bacterium]|nr:helix-turn-helix domain-containing protein [SAR202 cluster bacterium]
MVVDNKYKRTMNRLQKRLFDSMRIGDRTGGYSVVEEALMYNIRPADIYTYIIGGTLSSIGQLWHKGEITVAHEHLSSQLASNLIEVVLQKSPKLSSNGLRAVVTTPVGERHWVAAQMFSNLLILSGWEVDYLGTETPGQDLAQFVSSTKADVVALSIILDSNLSQAIDCVENLKDLSDPPVICVGGPVIKENDENFSDVFIVRDPVSAIEHIEKVMGLAPGRVSLQEMLNSIGEKVQEIRKAKGLNQESLAKLAGVDRAYVSLVENGKQNLTMAALFNLSSALGVTIPTLIQSNTEIE